VRAKFDVGSHRLGLAARLLLVREVNELPKMIRRVSLPTLENILRKPCAGARSRGVVTAPRLPRLGFFRLRAAAAA